MPYAIKRRPAQRDRRRKANTACERVKVKGISRRYPATSTIGRRVSSQENRTQRPIYALSRLYRSGYGNLQNQAARHATLGAHHHQEGRQAALQNNSHALEKGGELQGPSHMPHEKH